MCAEKADSQTLKEVTFDEFEPPSYEKWKESAEAALKGAPFDKKMYTKTYEGITLRPVYTLEDEVPENDVPPGCAPYVRGTDAAGYIKQPWKISQYVNAVLPEDANAALKEEIDRGSQVIHLALNRGTIECRDELNPEDKHGIHMVNLQDFQTTVEGLKFSEWPAEIQCGASAVPMLGMLAAHLKKKDAWDKREKVSGYIGADPIGYLIHEGNLPCSLDTLYDEMALAARWAEKNMPGCRTVLISSDCYHNGGANDVQEVAYCISTAIEYIDALMARGLTISEAAGQIAFSFSLGANYFMEIAKLRAVRKIWAQVIDAYGGDAEDQKICVLARTSAFTTSAIDPYVNVLRATTQTFSGVIGGLQSLTVTPFDEAVRESNDQARRIARNIQIMFREEFDLLEPVDPAGGSWYVENLTKELGQAIWEQIQKTDAAGGILQQLKDGEAQKAVAEILDSRRQKLATRADRAVGVNMYANMLEEPLDPNGHSAEELAEIRGEAVKKAQEAAQDCGQELEKLDPDGRSEEQDVISDAADAFLAGATLQQVRQALNGSGTGDMTVEPIPRARWTEPFEELRKRTEDYEKDTGKTIDIFLANMGPVTQYKARADFITGFMEVAHFRVLGSESFQTVEEAAKAAVEIPTNYIVICSSDPTYPELVPPLARMIKEGKPDATVYVAGAPAPEYKDEYLKAGVDDFIHVKSNCLQMLTDIQKKEGVI
ncbi:MAG: acyl-CoA mutase large subunit family protein [Oscillospiraceae bacterium]|nr:acyl-CoA mutase large subunit family protein [Oscillospiraceae bacterium]